MMQRPTVEQPTLLEFVIQHKPWNLRISGLFPQNPEELSGIANTADLLYTYSKGNLSSSQKTNGSGVSQTCNFKRRHHQHPAGGDDGGKQTDSRFSRKSTPVPLVIILRAHFYTG